MMPDIYQGGCACEAIRYECHGEPVATFNCHCRSCQRFTGASCISGLMLPRQAFTLLCGDPTYYTVPADNGHDMSRGFCGICGSPVVAHSTRLSDFVLIPAVSLDDPSWFKPSVDMYTEMAQPWHRMDPELPKFPQAPPSKG